MVAAGADIIDVGGESSRPGAEEVAESIELERISPLFDMVSALDVPFSIDTYKPTVARAALEHGFAIINDITGGGERGEMFELADDLGVPVIIMHMQGTPRTMQQNPVYKDVIETLLKYFSGKIALAKKLGLSDEQIILDPGIGFGKRVPDNDCILMKLEKIRELGYPVLVGASRKSFLAVEGEPPEERLAVSMAALAVAALKGANILRVHDVKESVKCVKFIHRLKQIN